MANYRYRIFPSNTVVIVNQIFNQVNTLQLCLFDAIVARKCHKMGSNNIYNNVDK